MKKIILVILITISFVLYLNPQVPIKILEVKWGKQEDTGKLGLLIMGGYLCPKAFGVDKQGNIYIDDSLLNFRIQKYDKYGNFIKSIPNKTNVFWGLDKIKILDNNNIF